MLPKKPKYFATFWSYREKTIVSSFWATFSENLTTFISISGHTEREEQILIFLIFYLPNC